VISKKLFKTRGFELFPPGKVKLTSDFQFSFTCLSGVISGMVMLSAGYHINGDESWAKEAVESLRTAGADLSPLNLETQDHRSCLLFFSQPDQHVFQLLRYARGLKSLRIIAIGAAGTDLSEEMIRSLVNAGASLVLSWGNSPSTVSDILSRLSRWNAVERLMESARVKSNLIGNSPKWISILRNVVEVAAFTNSSVLLEGESGTGKELLARLIHDLDPRPQKSDFVIVDCTTIVPELSGSEFYGHEKGAFTGAVGTRAGAFELADQGTLFLDEVGDLPLGLQAQLLRVIQERTFKRVGGNVWHKSEFRLISASNKNLLELIEKSRFRPDLYFRISGWTFTLPPLRKRPEDIPYLIRHFLEKLRLVERVPDLDDFVRKFLLSRRYQGNIRELEQLIRRISDLHVGSGSITVGDIPEEERKLWKNLNPLWPDEEFEHSIRRAVELGVGLHQIGRTAKELAVSIALSVTKGNKQLAAHKLCVRDRSIQLRVKNSNNIQNS